MFYLLFVCLLLFLGLKDSGDNKTKIKNYPDWGLLISETFSQLTYFNFLASDS